MTHLWPEGQPIVVEVDALGTPCRFVWLGQTHTVEIVANRWRVDEAWWRERIWREYFKLATDTGLLVVVFRDLVDGGWYVQRVYG
ncbi:MAG: hypothetical protein GX601_08430 [Anaerolineales bacterium]|nr:hypothetical protein [Anaerolineales bacterium]